ncbi:MAG TPA: hypothetical protein VLY04_19360 [Bryobacteraceae bacterium]|nr:hypothetical protein [Bryobacteraceae bacterium]
MKTSAIVGLFVFTLAAQQLALEKRAIELARKVPVSKLEPGLPKQALARWLTQAAGPAAKITWEVNDCGEQSGNPETDRGRDFPMCVDGIANLAGDRKAIVSVVMGTFQKGVTGPPRLWSVSVGKDNRFDPVSKLRDLPARIQAVN